MPTADVLDRALGSLAGGDATPWLVAGGVVALYLAYRAAKLAARLVSLGVAAALFLGAGPAGTWSSPSPVDLPWADDGAGDEDDAAGGVLPAREVPPPVGAFRAVVTGVTDGDSLRVRVTDPGDTEVARDDELEVRLLRIDAPELGRDDRRAECLADEATDALHRLVPPGTEVLGAHDLERRDRYDRELAHVWTSDGRWVNGALLAAGLARVATVAPNTGYEDDVRALEAAARSDRRGIWDPAVCADG